MAYLIDSDWLIDHLAEVPEAKELLDSIADDGLYLSVVSYMEAYQGTLRFADVGMSQRLETFVRNELVLDVGISVAQRCAAIRQYLSDTGKRPTRRGFDILIAATAIEYDLTLVTRNVRDYADIPDLKLYEHA